MVAAAGSRLHFPGDRWRNVSAETLGWDASLIQQAVDLAASSRSSALLITHGGSIVVEHYWHVEPTEQMPMFGQMQFKPLNDGQVVEDVASLQKSIVALLGLIAMERDLLTLDTPVIEHLGKGWSKAPEDAEAVITIRHLMSMTSGLTIQGEFASPAGTVWQYNTNMYSKMLRVLEAASGEQIGPLTRDWLCRPLGMQHSEWRERPWAGGALDANTLGFVTTARDLTRLGILVLAGGQWGNERVISDITPLTAPSQSLNPRYALLWWLNREGMSPGIEFQDEPFVPSAPREMLAALGALNRQLFVLPRQHVTVVRMGDMAGDRFASQLWELLAPAIGIEGSAGSSHEH